MSKEIFTTDNMNEIVTPIYEAMKAGNPVAKIVFDLNDAINSLKPGRPISKAERDRIEFMWDNLLVGHANEVVDLAKTIASAACEEDVSEDITLDDNSFDSVLYKWHKAYTDMIAKAEEKKEEGYSDQSKLVILDGLTNMLKTKGTKSIAKALEISEDLIIEVIRRSEVAEDKFFDELKPVNSLICVAESSYADGTNEEESCDEEECGDDNISDLEKELIDTLRSALDAGKAKKCKCRQHIRPVICKSKEAGYLFDKMLRKIMDM